jgi:hypothetical protein
MWGVEFFMLCDRDAVPSGMTAIDVESAAHNALRLRGDFTEETRGIGASYGGGSNCFFSALTFAVRFTTMF